MLRNVKLRWYKDQVCTAVVFETAVYMEPRDSECALRDTMLHLDQEHHAKLVPLDQIPCKFLMKGEGMFGWFFDACLYAGVWMWLGHGEFCALLHSGNWHSPPEKTIALPARVWPP